MKRVLTYLAILLLAIQVSPVHAIDPGEILSDPALESRARAISAELRCLVCQNQSIEDSDADLAKDLRVLVRERLKAGDTDDQIFDYVVARYGDFVLLNPPLKAKTILLWAGPAALLLSGVVAVAIYFRRRAAPAEDASSLSAEEERRLQTLLDGDGER
jgi:cytochrome c-type biogenesis protein CcmH